MSDWGWRFQIGDQFAVSNALLGDLPRVEISAFTFKIHRVSEASSVYMKHFIILPKELHEKSSTASLLFSFFFFFILLSYCDSSSPFLPDAHHSLTTYCVHPQAIFILFVLASRVVTDPS